MGAASGILTLDNKEYRLITFDYRASQPVTWNGKPSGRPSGFFIDLTIESDSDTSLLEWALGNEAKDGVITFYKPDGMSKFNEVKFKKAYCIRHEERFEANGKLPMRQIITISEPRYDLPKNVIAPPKKIVQQEKQETRVKTIKCMTSLDLGSANDNSGTNQQEGMLYGKTYEFKVIDFTEEAPTDKSVINWMYKYHSLSENKWIEKKLSITGETLKFTLNEKDMCGRFVYIRAYIKDAENEGELKVWKHNRFRWFDSLIVKDEIKERTDNNKPWLVNQSGTSLCGMACIFYLFAKEQPEEYKKLAKELFRTGEATFNSYTVKPSIDILGKIPFEKDFPFSSGFMPLVDYITMTGTRNTDNPRYKGGDEEFHAINWPPIMHTLCKNLLGYKKVSTKGVYNPVAPLPYTTSDIQIKIDDINNQIKAGYKLILMIDSDLIEDVWDFGSADLHWVVLESPIIWNYTPKFLGSKVDEIDFKVYSWGTNPFGSSRYLKKKIASKHFMNNYNGYIKIK